MIGVIADDLTGAAELGAVGWRHGLRTEVVSTASPSPDVDLVCVDTDSRSATPEEAARRVRSAALRLRRSGVRWIYKKVDSVLRGNVLAEVHALLPRPQCGSALVLPANPSLGRVVRQGRYYIHGKPIHQTSFRRDPEHPRLSAAVLDLLGEPGASPVQVCGVDTPRIPAGIVIGEASSRADLRQWAGRRSTFALVGGAAEFFEVLLEMEPGLGERRDPALEPVTGPAPRLFVCGSLSDATVRFVGRAREWGAPVFVPPTALVAGPTWDPALADGFVRRAVDALGRHPGVVLTTATGEPPKRSASRRVGRTLARLAVRVIRDGSVGHLCAEGGATAAHVLARLRWERLTVVHEFSPGVVTLRTGGGVRLTLKPGSYEWPPTVQMRLRSPEPGGREGLSGAA